MSAPAHLGRLALLRSPASRPGQFIPQVPSPIAKLASASAFSAAPFAAAATDTAKSFPSNRDTHGYILPHKFPVLNPTPFINNPSWQTALNEFKRREKQQSKEIRKLQCLLDSLRIASMPTNVMPLTKQPPQLPTSQSPQQGQQHLFQAMNRNARKAKRANHGKRPCSRDRRRWKVKKWANTSRRG